MIYTFNVQFNVTKVKCHFLLATVWSLDPIHHHSKPIFQFCDGVFLGGAQACWLKQYRSLPKITDAFAAGERAAVCNLLQNPAKMPVCGVFCPTLLRNGKLWVMHNPATDNDADKEAALAKERCFLPEEHLTLMAVPMFQQCSGKHAFPHINCDLGAGAMRSLAGNVA